MKKKKTIIIKNPRLRKIRNNFRLFLINWSTSLWSRLNDKYKKIHYDGDGRVRHSKEYTSEEKKDVESILKEMKEIDGIVNSSICNCTVWGAPDKYMTYNPVEKRWFCVDCYKLNQDFYKDTDQAYLYL